MHPAFGGVIAKNSVYRITSSLGIGISNRGTGTSRVWTPLTHLGVNHPSFPLNQLAVCVGPGGIKPNESKPNTNVIMP